MPNWFWPTAGTWWSMSKASTTTSTIHTQVWPVQATNSMSTWVTSTQTNDLYQFQMARLPDLGSFFSPSRPGLITHQGEARRDRELYRRALQEHDAQETARLLRLVEAHDQLDAEHRRIAEQQREQMREQERERDAAKLRARELLFEYLTPLQRETFDRNGWFVVEGGKSKTQYRIRAVESMVANVDVLLHGGRVKHRLCAHVRVGSVPLGDQLLAQKVMLELAEDDFLCIANRHP